MPTYLVIWRTSLKKHVQKVNIYFVVNPFDQPGVEDYKQNMFEMLGKPGYGKLKLVSIQSLYSKKIWIKGLFCSTSMSKTLTVERPGC